MNPIGIALAFVLFWAMIGLGLFLTFSGVVGLVRREDTVGIVVRSGTAQGTRQVAELIVNAVLLVVGLALAYAGAYATYTVIYR
ncbi:MAG: hypothetical protein HY675_11770 [Chloroflexi bacterium]|nr:hypothetical protein [Chloroflexota bacterium]